MAKVFFHLPALALTFLGRACPANEGNKYGQSNEFYLFSE